MRGNGDVERKVLRKPWEGDYEEVRRLNGSLGNDGEAKDDSRAIPP